MTMGDQKFTCGRYKNRTFVEIAENEPDFCRAVRETDVCNKYYPEEFKSYLLSLGRPPISESTVTGFVKQWDQDMIAEFQNIISTPTMEIRQVHPQASNYPNGNLGVFIRYFIKKCIFNVQNTNASSYCIKTFASIFPFRVSKTVPLAKLPVRELFDDDFYCTMAAFMVRHFESKCDSAVDVLDLFLRNVHHFQQEHFDKNAMRKLKSVVNRNPDKSSFARICDIDYLKQFPRLSQAGVVRYTQLRQVYNSLCAAFRREDLGDQHRSHIRKLPEINCYELLQLLDSDFYTGQRAKYINWFQKYLFFFVYALESVDDHPIFFIDDPLFECLKEYTEYQSSREVPEKLKLCIWMVTLIHRRTQPLNSKNDYLSFEVDDENLQHIRQYVENFPGMKSAVVDYVLPTSLLHLGIPIVTEDTVFIVFYKKAEMSNLSDFYEGIIRALMCHFNIKKIVIYNPYSGTETSMMVPPLKKEVLEFIRRYNKYDPAQPVSKEYIFTENLEIFFEENTIQWNDKCPGKSNPLPVYDYKEIFGDA